MENSSDSSIVCELKYKGILTGDIKKDRENERSVEG